MDSAAKDSQKNAALEAEISRLRSGNLQLAARVEALSAQLQWFQKQLFGQRSERRIEAPPKEQLFLGEQFQKETGVDGGLKARVFGDKRRASQDRAAASSM